MKLNATGSGSKVKKGLTNGSKRQNSGQTPSKLSTSAGAYADTPPALPEDRDNSIYKNMSKKKVSSTTRKPRTSAEIFCPQCQSSLEAEDACSILICSSCGWTYSKKNKDLAKRIDRNFQRWSYGISIGLVLCFIQCINWDTFCLTIIPLKVKVWSGTSTPKDVSEILAICTELKKHDCIHESHDQLVNMTPKDTANLSQFAHFLTAEKSIQKAKSMFQKYFTEGGSGVKEALAYAQLLDQHKQSREAKAYYSYVLKSESSLIRIKAVREYIQLLIKSKDFRLAKKVLVKFQRENKRNQSFMAKELKKINLNLKARRPIGRYNVTKNISFNG